MLWLLDPVTPFVGVWIETWRRNLSSATASVTPFVGVWIETLLGGLFGKHNTSHPSWVCGLKRLCCLILLFGVLVTPFVGVWIETRPYQ